MLSSDAMIKNYSIFVSMLDMYREANPAAQMTLIGCCLIKFAGGLSLIWGSCNIYFFSYLKHHGEDINATTNSKLILWALIPLLVTVPMANPFARWVGYQRAIRLCAVIFLLSPMVINLELNLTTFVVFWMVIPITCFMLSGIPLINCLWTQFPRHLNKVSGIAILTFSLGLIFWNLLFMMVVNPENEKSEMDPNINLPIFPQHISANVIKASNLVFAISGIMNLTGSFLVSKKTSSDLEEPINTEKDSPSAEGDIIVSLQQAISRVSNKSQLRSSVLKSLTDKRFILLFLVSGLNPIFLVYLMQNMKLIYMPIINDDHFLSYCAAIVTVSAVIGAPFWGYLGDLRGFRVTLLLITIVDTIVKLLGVHSNEKWSLALLFLMLGANDRGLLTIVGPGLIGMFGIEMATELIPYKGLALILSYVTAPVIQLFLFDLPYESLLYVFTGCSVLGVLLSGYLKYKIQYTEIDPAQSQDHELKPTKMSSDF